MCPPGNGDNETTARINLHTSPLSAKDANRRQGGNCKTRTCGVAIPFRELRALTRPGGGLLQGRGTHVLFGETGDLTVSLPTLPPSNITLCDPPAATQHATVDVNNDITHRRPAPPGARGLLIAGAGLEAEPGPEPMPLARPGAASELRKPAPFPGRTGSWPAPTPPAG